MRGDVLFWTSDGSLISRAIALCTGGPFSHVSVDEGDGTDVGAHSEDGIRRRPVPQGSTRGIVAVSMFDLAARGIITRPVDVERGMRFVEGEIGNRYGFCNILNNALKLLRCPYRIARIDRYDCSSLVTRYLEKVGVDLGDLGEEPDSVSPNDLARALLVIK